MLITISWKNNESCVVGSKDSLFTIAKSLNDSKISFSVYDGHIPTNSSDWGFGMFEYWNYV